MTIVEAVELIKGMFFMKCSPMASGLQILKSEPLINRSPLATKLQPATQQQQ